MHQPGWLSGAIHFIIVAIAFQAESGEVWPYALLAMSAVSFFAWVANYRRYRAIQDLPTSKVASAAQGYVELFGRAELLAGEPVPVASWKALGDTALEVVWRFPGGTLRLVANLGAAGVPHEGPSADWGLRLYALALPSPVWSTLPPWSVALYLAGARPR